MTDHNLLLYLISHLHKMKTPEPEAVSEVEAEPESKQYKSQKSLKKNPSRKSGVNVHTLKKTKLKIGSNIGSETITREYKAMYLDKRVALEVTDQRRILQSVLNSGRGWDSHILTLFTQRLQSYLEVYVPKYAVSFGNTIDRKKNAYMYFGVSDNGEVFGVPISNQLKESNYLQLKKRIMKIVEDSVSMILGDYTSSHKSHFLKKIKIDIIELPNDLLYLATDSHEAYVAEYELSMVEYDDGVKLREKIMKEWIVSIERYKQAINKMLRLKCIRLEIIDFINDFTLDDPIIVESIKDTNFTSLSEDEVKSLKVEMVRRMSDDDVTLENVSVTEEKNDARKLAFWVATFRDYKSSIILANRPFFGNKKKVLSKPMCPYFRMLRDMRPLISPMISSGVQFCLIRFKFPTKTGLGLDFPTLYLNGRYIERTLDHSGEPITVS